MEKTERSLLITFLVLVTLLIAAFAFAIGAGYVKHKGYVKEISSHYYLIVKEGDTLSEIAQKLGGTTNLEKIVNVSERNMSLLKNPKRLRAGMLIEIPSSWIKLD